MSKIVIASQNPVKLQTTLNGFELMFPDKEFEIESVSVSSGVKDQPMSSEEALTGAQNRTEAARNLKPEADYWVGIEAGLKNQAGELISFSWVVILSDQSMGRARTGAYFMPGQLADLVMEGKELGVAVDMLFGEANSKQKSGAVGLLTKGVLGRAELYEQAVVLALIPFLNPELFSKKD